MKKLLTILGLTSVLFSTAAMADPYHGHRGYHGHNGHRAPTVVYRDSNWVAPLIIGGFAAAIIADANKRAVEEQRQVIIVQQEPIITTPQVNCTAWKEIQNGDGTIYRERTCYQVTR
jgi:hypothetical protein